MSLFFILVSFADFPMSALVRPDTADLAGLLELIEYLLNT